MAMFYCKTVWASNPVWNADAFGGLPSYYEMSRQDRNATAALFIMHSACYRAGQPVYEIASLRSDSAVGKRIGDFIFRLAGQRGYFPISLWNHLQSWDLSGADFSYANLEQSNFRHALLQKAIFAGVISFDHNNAVINRSGANLARANLQGADCRGANFFGANLFHAILIDANMQGAIFEGADLPGADLSRANLSDAEFSGMFRDRSDLSSAVIEQARFEGSDVTVNQLASCEGDPAIMPDGNPPKTNWRTAGKVSRRRKSKPGKPPAPPHEGPG